ncbi:molybdopterin-dependent oxidoreductase, partial [Chamaesiphon sp. OTE_20_metabat_361]
MNDETPEATGRISRRQLLKWAGAGLLVNAAGTLLYDPIGRLSMPLNEAVEALLLSSKPTPEFPISAIEPDRLIVNSFRGTPKIDIANFQLKISGEVANPLSLNMAEIQQLPLTSMVIRQVCVEGWAAIVQWGGVRLQDLLQIAQPRSSAKY